MIRNQTQEQPAPDPLLSISLVQRGCFITASRPHAPWGGMTKLGGKWLWRQEAKGGLNVRGFLFSPGPSIQQPRASYCHRGNGFFQVSAPCVSLDSLCPRFLADYRGTWHPPSGGSLWKAVGRLWAARAAGIEAEWAERRFSSFPLLTKKRGCTRMKQKHLSGVLGLQFGKHKVG